MPQQGFHCIVDFVDVSFEECIDCAATRGRCHLTASLLRGMADQARARNADNDARSLAARRRAGAAVPLPVVDARPADVTCHRADGHPYDRADDGAQCHENGIVHPAAGGAPPGDTPASYEHAAPGAAPAADDDGAGLGAGGRAATPAPVLSVTELTGCVRQAYLKATEPFYQRPDQQYWSYRGTLGHLLAERGAGPGIVAEHRFERELRLPGGLVVTITGQPDEIDPARGLLIDYKTTDRAPRQPSPLHIAQLNVYRWLVAPQYQIERLGIVYLTMKAVQKASVPIWPDGQVERLLHERAGALAEAYAGGAWPALTEDRWMCNFCPVTAACERGSMHLAAS